LKFFEPFVKLFLFFPLLCFGLDAFPWGKDADLAYTRVSSCCESQTVQTPLFGPFAEAMIAFHQNVISPCDGPRSHFRPSSSQYTLESMRQYGFFRGLCMGCDRLMRENNDPWVYRITLDGAGKQIKYDPVPILTETQL